MTGLHIAHSIDTAVNSFEICEAEWRYLTGPGVNLIFEGCNPQ
jgi:hypothetical protein